MLSIQNRLAFRSVLNNTLVRNSSSDPPLDTTTTSPGRKTRRQRLRVREGQSTNVYPRAIPVGKNHVYDQALRVIVKDASNLQKELKSLHPLLEQAKAINDAKQIDHLNSKRNILEIASRINLPSVRWRFIRGTGNMLYPVYRHLAEQKWRNDGDLDLVMERVYQMHIVPDLLPAIHPTLDLRVLYNEPPPNSRYLRTRTIRRQVAIEAGTFLVPEQTRRPPALFVTAFHVDPRYYTLVMLDPDSPSPETQSFKTYLHWIIPNIQLNCQTTRLKVPASNYVPPHPQQGSPYHRYTLLLLQNPAGKHIDCDAEPYLSQRDKFDLRHFCSTHGFNLDRGGGGGGIFMWREVWNDTVSDIYKQTLKQPEPRYGRMPGFDMYSEVKEMQKYI